MFTVCVSSLLMQGCPTLDKKMLLVTTGSDSMIKAQDGAGEKPFNTQSNSANSVSEIHTSATQFPQVLLKLCYGKKLHFSLNLNNVSLNLI